MLTFGSLFAGIGGFDLGLERAGMACKWQVEIDDYATHILEKHWPNVARYRDVRECGAANLEPVDVVCGGFPCQDVSVAGKRAGLAGERSGLWYEFHRILAELKPRWVVIENVPGLLSSNRGRDFAAILRGLAGLGYLSAWRVLDAQYFGVPQRRRRVFLVGCLGDGRAAQVLFEREGGAWDSPPSREAGAGATRSPAIGATSSGYRYNPNGEECVTGYSLCGHADYRTGPGTLRASGGDVGGGGEIIVAATLNSGGNNGGFRAEPGAHLVAYQCQGTNVGEMGTLRSGNGHVTGGIPFVAHALRAEGADASEDGTGRGTPLVIGFDKSRSTVSGDVAAPLRVNGGAAPGVNDGKEDNQCIAFEPRFARNGRGAPDMVVPPLKAQSGRTGKGDGAPCVAFSNRMGGAAGVTETLRADSHGALPMDHRQRFGVRRLTPVECERLQAFPDGWTEGESDSARYRMLGNAVCVNVAAWIGRRVMEAAS